MALDFPNSPINGQVFDTGGKTWRWTGSEWISIPSGATVPSTNSANWDSTYTTVNTNSANWDSTYTTVNTNSAGWDNASNAYVTVACSDETTDIVTGIANTFRIPYNFNVTSVRASVNTAPVGADIEIDITANGVSIFDTRLFIDNGDETSIGSATTPILNANANLVDDEEVVINVITVGSTTPGLGLKVSFIGTEV